MESRPSWFNIPRESPEYVVQHSGREFLFTYHNTKVCLFPDEFKQFNHIFYTSDEKCIYIFVGEDDGTRTAMDDLHAYGYPMIYEPWPSEQDVEAFIQAEMQDMA